MIPINVGDKAIYKSKYGIRPTIGTITKVTPKRWLYIILPDKDISIGPFKPVQPDSDVYRRKGLSIWSHVEYIFAYSDDRLNELCNEAAEAEIGRKQKEDARKAQKDALEKRQQEEIKVVKELCLDILPIQSSQVLLDGTRLYLLNIPVHPSYKERKKGFEILIARVIDAVTIKDEKIVRLYSTECNGINVSFSSCSGIYGKDDDTVLWELAANRYHNAW